MKLFFPYILLISLFLKGVSVNAQIEDILKPVEIRPPSPSIQAQQKQQSDEQLAAQYFRNRDFEKAAILYERIFEEKNNPVYYTYFFYCLLELGEFDKADKLVRQQMKDNPGNLKYMIDLGYIYSQKGEQAKAKKQFESVLKDLPANRAQITELSNAFFARAQTEYAAQVFIKGRDLVNYPFFLELGNLYRQTRNVSGMVEAWLDYIDYDSFNAPMIRSRMQNALDDDQDNMLSDYLKYALLQRIQKEPDKTYFSEMLLWLSIQNKDFVQAFNQARAIDRRLNEDGERLMDLARVCISNDEYDIAVDAFQYVLKKGKNSYLYVDARIGLLYAHYLKVIKTPDFTQKDLTDLEAEYLTTLEEYGRNSSTVMIMKHLAHLQAFYLDNPGGAVTLLNEAIEMRGVNPSDNATIKIELADVLTFTGDVWEAKLLYAQVERAFRNDPVGHEAKFKNAKLSFYLGEYDWAKAQLDVLKAATSKLIANDALEMSVFIGENLDADSLTHALDLFARADMLVYRNKKELAMATLDSIFDLASWHSIFDDVLLKKAEIRISQNRYEEAATYLNRIVTDFSYEIKADKALFMLAGLTENKLNDAEKAKELYEKLLMNYPGSLYTVEARKRFRDLRGDFTRESVSPEERFFYNIEVN
jgi:tetratricopeptide (TPR) repeat protein